MAIDLNAVQAPQTPVTLQASGVIGVLTWRDTFETTLAEKLTAASLPAESLSVSFPLFSTAFNATIILRTNGQVVTAGQVAYVVRQALQLASGNAPDAVSVTRIGKPGEAVTPAAQPSIFDPLIEWLREIFGTLSTATRWVIALLAVGLVLWLAIETGLASKVRQAVA